MRISCRFSPVFQYCCSAFYEASHHLSLLCASSVHVLGGIPLPCAVASISTICCVTRKREVQCSWIPPTIFYGVQNMLSTEQGRKEQEGGSAAEQDEPTRSWVVSVLCVPPLASIRSLPRMAESSEYSEAAGGSGETETMDKRRRRWRKMVERGRACTAHVASEGSTSSRSEEAARLKS